MNALRRLAKSVLLVSLTAGVVAGCSDDGEGEGDGLEVQVINGLANDSDHGHIVRVTTARTTERDALGFGDSTDPSNWTYFDLALDDGDVVEFAIEASGGATLVSGDCIVEGADAVGYARAYVSVVQFAPGIYVNCAEGFASDGL